jgi:ribosome biogenesis GTPase
VLCERGSLDVVVPPRLVIGIEGSIAIGDWLLVEHEAPRVLRVLERRSLISRMAAGVEQRMQAIAANLDTLFVVTSCNDDFNLSRLERYFTVARHAQVETVIVLTKADLCTDAESFAARARSIARNIAVLSLNATENAAADGLTPWLARGQTVAFVGSSGVGKSTLVNALLARQAQATGGIREHDAKGRHTTTSRQMFALPSGAWVIDTPGMRELKLGSVEAAVSEVFDDIEALAKNCRFRDCQHRDDAGCVLHAAVAAGHLDARRLSSYQKLQREAERASQSQHERRAIERRWGRMHRTIISKRGPGTSRE